MFTKLHLKINEFCGIFFSNFFVVTIRNLFFWDYDDDRHIVFFCIYFLKVFLGI